MSQARNRQEIVLLGVNHRTAPVEVRERLALRELDRPALDMFASLDGCEEVVFLSTCNRVEVIASCRDRDECCRQIMDAWLRAAGLEGPSVEGCLYRFENSEAVRHIFRVASSLDSMIVGEPQILGQLKDAYREAAEKKSSGQILNRLFHKAFSVAKRIRTETRIASQAVSISYAAVELARKIFGDLSGKRALLVGAGEMAELAAQHLKTHGVKDLMVANRTLERAVQLAGELGGKALSLEELDSALIEADIVISSTGAPGIVIPADLVRSIMRPRRHRLLFFIDIAVPRDIDPAVNDIENVYLYDIDELKEVVEENKAERQKEAKKAERMVEEEVIKFARWLDSLDIVPIIQRLQEKAEEVRQRELKKTLKKLPNLSDKERAAIERLSKSLAGKLLHDPIIYLKKGIDSEERDQALAAVCRIFGIDEEE
jgi:glutamyl-tRNA reductase